MWLCALRVVGLLLLMLQSNEGSTRRHRSKDQWLSPQRNEGSTSRHRSKDQWRVPQYKSFRSRFGIHNKDNHRNVSLARAFELLNERGLSEGTRSTLRRHRKAGLRGLSHKSVDKAITELNTMRLQALTQLDIELSRCETYHETSEIALDSMHEAQTFLASKESSADALIMEARARGEESMGQVEDLYTILKDHEEKCKEEIALGKQDLLVMDANLKSATAILSMTKCKPSLLQCGGSHPTSKAMAVAANDALAAREQLVFTQLSSRRHSGHRRLQHRRTHDRHHALRKSKRLQTVGSSRHHLAVHQKGKSTREATAEVQSIMARIHQLVNASNTKLPDPLGDQHKHRCTIDNNPNCDAFTDSMMSMVGDVFCKKFEVENDLSLTEAKCEALKSDYQGQIQDIKDRSMVAGVDLAKSTKEKNDEEFQASMKQAEFHNVMSDFHMHMHGCEENLAKTHEAICSVESMRSELFSIEAVTGKTLQDCEVSDWVLSACSVTCGGGERIKTREVLIKANGGSACPPLEERESCSSDPCPQDCVVGEWQPWGGCNVDCGGGIRQRSRSVLWPEAHGGEPCSLEHVVETCNVMSCDSDCVLSEWHEWSGCSKACGGGFQQRDKKVQAPATGHGQCPPHRIKTQEFRRCNVKACAKKDIKCNSKVDVVLAIDGSGSAGKEGFTKTVSFVEKLVGAFKTGDDLVQVGVLLYSGPKSWEELDKCLKTGDEASCNLKVVSQLSKDGAAVATAVKALTTWPKASTFTSGALSMAHSLLREGRQDAQSVVVTFMTGMPNFKCRTKAASNELRKASRLMFVPIGSGPQTETAANFDLEEIKLWASVPTRENVIPIAHVKDLDTVDKLREIIYAICPKVE